MKYHCSCSEILDVVLSLLFLPESKVLFEEFNDALCISKCLFINFIDFVHGLLESSLSESARLLAILHDLIVEHREV
jgi:hypothetical protein